MKKLTSEKCRHHIDRLHGYVREGYCLSLIEADTLKAFEIALPVLEQQESKRQVTLREAVSELLNLNDKSGGYNFEALRAEQDNSDWISCSERMPEEREQVILWDADLDEHTSGHYSDQTGKFYSGGMIIDNEITHWMPAPASPQPKTDTYRQIENDGWVEWSGGGIPVDKLLLIEPKLRSGKIMPPEIALYWDWKKRNTDNDIIAYRVIENDGSAK